MGSAGTTPHCAYTLATTRASFGALRRASRTPHPYDATRTLTINGSNFASGNIVQFKWGVPPGNGVRTTSKSAPRIGSSSQMTVSHESRDDVIQVRVCRSAS